MARDKAEGPAPHRMTRYFSDRFNCCRRGTRPARRTHT